MTQNPLDDMPENIASGNSSEINLTDDDIRDAMQQIPGYLDISTEDFRAVYHLAYQHALGRLYTGVTAGRLMRKPITPLQQNTTLDQAARILADSGYKSLPVLNANGNVVGILTETDFLKHMHVDSFLELLLNMLEDSFKFTHSCHDTTVSAAMTQPAVTVGQDAGFAEILAAFHQHKGRSMPVVGADGRLLGLLQLKDFCAAYKLKVSS